jgi:hypothetical protein
VEKQGEEMKGRDIGSAWIWGILVTWCFSSLRSQLKMEI